MVDKNVDRKGTRELATAYLQFLYTEAGQELAAKHHIRTRDIEMLARYVKVSSILNVTGRGVAPVRPPSRGHASI